MDTDKLNRRKFLQITGAAAFSFSGKAILTRLKPDVIIIGAGATGCNAAWHLKKLGHSVTVIESAPGPATQASQAAAGFVANWSGLHIPAWGKIESGMQRYGIEFYTHLAGRTKKDIGFKKTGICYLFTKEESWKNGTNHIENCRHLGIPFEILNKERSRQLLPVIEFNLLKGIVYDPSSVRVRAADTIPFLAEEAARKGVNFIYNTKVLSFKQSGSRIIGVNTDKGVFEAGNILITAGAWSLNFLNNMGIHPPVTPLVEARYTTPVLEEVPSNLPLLIFSDIGFYIREENGGLLIGGGDHSGQQDRNVNVNNLPTSDKLKDHPQIGRIKNHLPVINKIMPVISKAGIKEARAGIPTFTKDIHFIADRVSPISNLFVITACQEAGITHGPALGKMMAELISTGSAPEDLSKFRLDRF